MGQIGSMTVISGLAYHRLGTSAADSMMFLMATITWRVEELAARRGWGTSQLAIAAGLDAKTVRHILTGRATRVDLDTIAKLANALGVEPGALWHTRPRPDANWDATAGVAGEGTDEDLAEVIAGRWSEHTDPALERATRSS